MIRFAVMFFVVSAASALAEEWVEVGSDNDSVHYVDRESLTRTQDVVRLTKKVIFKVGQISAFTKGSQSIKFSVGTIQEDCNGHQHRVVSIELFSEAGEAIWSSGKMNRIWESVEPESVGANTQEFACGSSQ